MKTLYLLRHAKSSWADGSLKDVDRPLNARGRRATLLVGAYLRRERIRPDVVLCSPAVRAKETLARVGEVMSPDKLPVIHDEALYAASPSVLLDRIRAHGGDHQAVMLVAHNPGIQELAVGLAGRGKAEALDRLAGKYPTAGLATIAVDCAAWSDLKPGDGTLMSFVVPKQLQRLAPAADRSGVAAAG